jgi:hypothetical protein
MEGTIDDLRVIKEMTGRFDDDRGDGAVVDDNFDPRPEVMDEVARTDLPAHKKAELYADRIYDAMNCDTMPE